MEFKRQANKTIMERHILYSLELLNEQLDEAIVFSLTADERTVKTNEIIVKINELLLELENLI